MALRTEVAAESGLRPSFTEEVTRKAKPIKWLAFFGVFFLALQAYIYARWIASGNIKPIPHGPDAIPTWMTFAVHFQEILGIAIFFGMGYWVVVRPWRRERHVPTVGMLYLGLITVYWQDVAANYFNHVYTWNTHFWMSRGSWYNFIPGWVSPRGNHLAEPLLFAGPINVWGVVLPAVVVAGVMRWAKRRWPQLGTVGLLAVALSLAAVIDLVIESTWIHTGLYAFTGTIPKFSVFSGRYYQFPVYEMLFAGAYFGGMGAFLYFKDDRGRSIIERGIDTIKTKSPAQKAGVRFVAFAGFANLMLLSYNVLFSLTTLYPGFTWSEDIVQRRSYLRDDICGAGTTYACPGKDIPIPRRGGLHVSPEGTLVPAEADPASSGR